MPVFYVTSRLSIAPLIKQIKAYLCLVGVYLDCMQMWRSSGDSLLLIQVYQNLASVRRREMVFNDTGLSM